MRDLLFHFQRGGRTPLQTQLRELLVSAILQGQIPVGSPLPSSRKPLQLDTRETERPAALPGILIEPGDIHFLGKAPPRHCFRLGFSSIPVDRIEPGLQKLGDIIQAQLTEPGAAAGRPLSVVI